MPSNKWGGSWRSSSWQSSRSSHWQQPWHSRPQGKWTCPNCEESNWLTHSWCHGCHAHSTELLAGKEEDISRMKKRTTDNRSLAKQIVTSEGWTEREEKRISKIEEELEESRKALVLRKADYHLELAKVTSLKEALQKEEALQMNIASSEVQKSSQAFDGHLPSSGSHSHCAGTCTPCKFFRSQRGCKHGTLCELCHFPHGELTLSAIRKSQKRAGLKKRDSQFLRIPVECTLTHVNEEEDTTRGTVID